MTKTTLDVADKIAMYVGGGLMLLGIPVMGLLNVLTGSETPLYTYELTQNGETTTGNAIATGMAPEGATIVDKPMFDPTLRAYIIAAGVLVFGLYAVYRLIDHRETDTESQVQPATAD